MSDTNHRSANDILDQATAALRGVAVSEAPPERVVASTIEALNARFTEINNNPPEILRRENERKQRMFRIARYSSLAAAIVLMFVGTGVVLFFDRGALPAFGQVVENVKKATSVSCTVRTALASMHKIELKYYMQGRFIRMEIPGKQESFDAKMPFATVAVINLDDNKTVLIDFTSKTFRSEKANIDKALLKQFSSPVEWLSTITDKDAERIGEEQLNGRKTYVYRLLRINLGDKERALEEGETAKAWVDAESNLPVRIAVEVFGPTDDRKSKSTMTAENFVWNKPFDPGLFKLEVPEGFTVEGEPPMSASEK